MKGPGLRIGLDVRRIWQCPACGRVSKSAVDSVAQRCSCKDEGVWMQLQDPPQRKPVVRVNPPAEVDNEDGKVIVAVETAVVEAVAIETVTVEILSVTTETMCVEAPVAESPIAESPRADEVDEGSLA